MKKIRIIALLAAVVMFGSLFLIVNGRTNKGDNDKKANSNTQTISVVKAKSNIPPYTTITGDMLELHTTTVDADFTDYFATKEDVVGHVSVSDIFAGEIVSPRRVVAEDDITLGLAYKIEEGMRAVTVAVDIEQGVANTIKAGNYVDVIFTAKISAAGSGSKQEVVAGAAFDSLLGENSPANTQVVHNQVGDNFSSMVMQKIKVLALDDKFFYRSGEAVTGNTYGSVTLEVTPEQAEQIVLLNDYANIYLALRGQDDDGTVNEPRGEILESYSPDAP